MNVPKPDGNASAQETYAISYVDDEGDVVSITSDSDLAECIRINLNLQNEKADLYLHNPHEPAPIENIKLIHKSAKNRHGNADNGLILVYLMKF